MLPPLPLLPRCCSVCCYTAAVAAAALQLLPAAVRHRVPDGQICCWFIEYDSSVLFLFIQTRFMFDGTPLGSTVPHLLPPVFFPTSSVITAMRGAKAGVSPPR